MVEIDIESQWSNGNIVDIEELYVSLIGKVDTHKEKNYGTKLITIGKSETCTWPDLPKGNYYLIIETEKNINFESELLISIDVKT